MVSTHSRPKAAGQTGLGEPASKRRFNSQPPEGGWPDGLVGSDGLIVSTHSRPKAAGGMPPRKGCTFWRFNSQPPEGGWDFANDDF